MVRAKLKSLVSWGKFSAISKKRTKQTNGERVAVKIYKPEYRALNDDIPNEIQALTHLRHDNVIRLLGTVRISRDFNGQMAVIMEFAAGGSLEQALQRRKISNDQHSVSIIFQIASGLAYLHDNDIVHNNFKPSNVLFKDTNLSRVAIADFSKIESQLAAILPHRCSPLFESPSDVDHCPSSNVYSLAMVACCVLLRRLPDSASYIIDYFVPNMRTCPARYQVICKALLEKGVLRPTAVDFMGAFDPYTKQEGHPEGRRWLPRVWRRATRVLRSGSQPLTNMETKMSKENTRCSMSLFAKRLSMKFERLAVTRISEHKRNTARGVLRR